MSPVKLLPRLIISVLLLAAHLLVATHSAFVTHERASSGSGELQHRHAALGAEATEHQRHAQSSWCGRPAESSPGAELACTAAKVAQTPGSLEEGATALDAPSDGEEAASGHRWARNPVAVLSWAPKASPPRAASS